VMSRDGREVDGDRSRDVMSMRVSSKSILRRMACCDEMVSLFQSVVSSSYFFKYDDIRLMVDELRSSQFQLSFEKRGAMMSKAKRSPNTLSSLMRRKNDGRSLDFIVLEICWKSCELLCDEMKENISEKREKHM